MNTHDDPTLRELFHATHRANEDAAPEFERVWSSASTHHRHQRRVRFVRWSAVPALLAVTAILAIHRPSPSRKSADMALPWQSVILLSEWQAPTDSLLSASEPAPFSLDLHL